MSHTRIVRRAVQEATTGGDAEEHGTQRDAERLDWSVVEKVTDQRWFRVLVASTTIARVVLTVVRFFHEI